MALQTDRILFAPSAGLPKTVTPGTTDTFRVTAPWEFASDVKIEGNLVATKTVSVENEEMRVQDNHIYLNDGYTTAVAQTGGLVVNYLPTATTDTVNGNFTAGVAATSNPTVVTTGSATFSANDFVQISGANKTINDGLYEVLSHTGTTLTVRGVGTTGTVFDFSEDQFEADTVTTGSITKVTISVLRAGTDGVWETGSGADTSALTFSDIGSGAGNTLQQAYKADVDGGGATITTDATDGSVIIAGDQSLRVSATNGLDVDTIFDFDGTSFDVQMTGDNGFSIDGAAASNVTVAADAAAEDLTISLTGAFDASILVNSAGTGADAIGITTTAGGIEIDGQTKVDINSAAGAINIGNDAVAQGINIGTGAAARTITIGNATGATALNLDAGTGGVTIDTTDGGALSIDAIGAPSNISLQATLAADDLTVEVTGAFDASLRLRSEGTGADALQVTTTAGGIEIDGQTKVDINSAAGAINIGNDAVAQGINVGTGAAARTITIGNVTGATQVDVNTGTGGFLVDTTDGGAISLDATGAPSNLSLAATAAADDLTIEVTGAQDASLVLRSEGTGADALQITATAGGIDINVVNNNANALDISDGTTTFITVDSNGDTLNLPAFTDISGPGVGVRIVTDDALAQGDIVRIKATTGNVGLADADTGTLEDGLGVAVSTGTFAATNTATLVTVHGSLVPMLFGTAPAAASNGSTVFLSTAPGEVTLTAPSTSGSVVFAMGILQGGDGADTTPLVLFSPQYLYQNG